MHCRQIAEVIQNAKMQNAIHEIVYLNPKQYVLIYCSGAVEESLGFIERTIS